MPLVSWILNFVYLAILTCLAPFLCWRSARTGRYRDGAAQKLLGRLPRSTGDQAVLWLHAVSVGEVLQLETIIPGLRKRRPDAQILISTTTQTGLGVAREKFPDARCCYYPLDFSWAVRNAIRRVRPQAIILVELELWPNLILHAHRAGVRLALINGRVSDRSFRGYRRLRWIMRPLLRRLEVVGAQTADYAQRLKELGAKNAVVTGSIKFDGARTDRQSPGTSALRQLFRIAPADLVLIAGSTQAPEEIMALRAWQTLRIDWPQLRLIIVPRHKERFVDVARTLAAAGANVFRRSTASDPVPGDAVILLDTLGELSDCWGLADIAFVGGSFGSRGGQNMLEPAAFGAAVLFGPKTSNFRDVVDLLLREQAATVVPATEQFEPIVRHLLEDPVARARMGQAATAVVRSQAGAAQRTIDVLEPVLSADANGLARRIPEAA